jgi:probable phosphoglycerate mutase
MAQGSTDIPLNEVGRDQARAAAPLLVGRGITTIISSPLTRAIATAVVASEQLDLPVTIEPELHEVSFGEKEGKPMLAQWFADWISGHDTPAGAESFAALRARCARVVNAILADYPAPILIVAHGGLFRALRANMGLAPDIRLANAIPQHCAPPRQNETSWTITPATPPA